MKLKRQQIPNILTIFRILVTIVIATLFVLNTYLSSETIYQFKIIDIVYKFNTYYLCIAILTFLGMMSDFLDGYLARKFNWVSEWGKIWDPIADKVLINTVLICLSTTNVVPFILVVIFISRDTIVDAYRISAIKKNINVAANLWGKLKTIFQFFALIILLFLFNGQLQENYGYWTWQNGLLIIACLFSIISGIVYVKCFNYKKN